MDQRIQRAREIIAHEAEAVQRVADRIGPDFCAVVDLVLARKGRVVTAGMGKAGIIATKVSATLASTGTPSIYLHPAEAIHGDLGRIGEGDVLLAFSKSGETQELLIMLPHVKSAAVPIVSVTQSRNSTMGRHSDIVLELGAIDESGPHGLAPSASTTAMLALGDALALVVQEGRNFGPQEFARFHPGGDLGRKLMKVDELMRRGDRNPAVESGSTLLFAIEVMTRTPGRPGATSITTTDGSLLGFFTDGDLRRLIERGLADPRTVRIDDVMTKNPRRISDETFALEALGIMRQLSIDQLPVVDAQQKLIGLLDVQDLLDLRIG